LGASQNPGGTPKSKNSISEEIKISLSPTPPLALSPSPQISPNQSPPPSLTTPTPLITPEKIIYPSNIVINEVLPAPIGPDETEEWIEIFNQNNFETNLSSWQISDASGKTTIYTIPENTKFGPNGFLIFGRPTTKITLNNDEDMISLSNPRGEMVDKINYKQAPQGQSYNRTESGWVWSAILTPGSKNITSVIQSSQSSAEINNSKKKDLTKENSNKKTSKLASIGEEFPKEKSPHSPFLIALSLAILSGFAILFLKKKVQQ